MRQTRNPTALVGSATTTDPRSTRARSHPSGVRVRARDDAAEPGAAASSKRGTAPAVAPTTRPGRRSTQAPRPAAPTAEARPTSRPTAAPPRAGRSPAGPSGPARAPTRATPATTAAARHPRPSGITTPAPSEPTRTSRPTAGPPRASRAEPPPRGSRPAPTPTAAPAPTPRGGESLPAPRPAIAPRAPSRTLEGTRHTPAALIVDGDPAHAERLLRAVEDGGFVGVVAVSTAEAHAGLEATSFDALLLDVRLPAGDSAFGLLAALRERQRALPTLVVAREHDVRLANRAQLEGVELLYEPFERTHLVRFLERARARAAASLRGLSPLQRRIVDHARRGLSRRATALALGLSENTLKSHIKRILALSGDVSIAALCARLARAE